MKERETSENIDYPPATLPSGNVMVKLLKFSTKLSVLSAIVTFIFDTLLSSDLPSSDSAMSLRAADAESTFFVCSRMKSTATRAKSKTRWRRDVDPAVADAVADAAVVVVLLGFDVDVDVDAGEVSIAPPITVLLVVAVVDGTLKIGGGASPELLSSRS